jgi:CHAT domain-containing protein
VRIGGAVLVLLGGSGEVSVPDRVAQLAEPPKQAEGTVGLQRAFLAKGARSVLVSLWSVSDEVTAALMQRFYTHWLEDADAPSKAEALRRAQAEIRVMGGWEHPRFWAAFQLVGAR